MSATDDASTWTAVKHTQRLLVQARGARVTTAHNPHGFNPISLSSLAHDMSATHGSSHTPGSTSSYTGGSLQRPSRAEMLAELAGPSLASLPPQLRDLTDDELHLVWSMHRSAVGSGRTPSERRAALESMEKRMEEGGSTMDFSDVVSGFATGSRVRIHALKSATDLNGGKGIVVGYDPDAMRIIVEIPDTSSPSGKRQVRVKPANLQRV